MARRSSFRLEVPGARFVARSKLLVRHTAALDFASGHPRRLPPSIRGADGARAVAFGSAKRHTGVLESSRRTGMRHTAARALVRWSRSVSGLTLLLKPDERTPDTAPS